MYFSFGRKCCYLRFNLMIDLCYVLYNIYYLNLYVFIVQNAWFGSFNPCGFILIYPYLLCILIFKDLLPGITRQKPVKIELNHLLL